VDVSVAGAGSAGGLDFEVGFGEGLRLSGVATPYSVSGGSTVQLTAAVVDETGAILVPSGPASLAAFVVLPDASQVQLSMADDGLSGDGLAGDGTYGVVYSATAEEGIYNVVFQADANFGAARVQRSGQGSFAVQPSGASLLGGIVETPVDADGDGLWEKVEFSQTVATSNVDDYAFMADVADVNGKLISQVVTSVDPSLSPGSQDLVLSVDSADIVANGVSGGVVLTKLRLLDLDKGSLAAATAPDYVSAPYSLSALAAPAPPVIGSLTPASGDRRGGNTVVLHGNNLSGVQQVLIGGVSASFVPSANDAIIVTVPPSKRRKVRHLSGQGPQLVSVQVVTPWGQDVEPGAYAYVWK